MNFIFKNSQGKEIKLRPSTTLGDLVRMGLTIRLLGHTIGFDLKPPDSPTEPAVVKKKDAK